MNEQYDDNSREAQFEAILHSTGDGRVVLDIEDLEDFVILLVEDYAEDGAIRGTPEELTKILAHWREVFNKCEADSLVLALEDFDSIMQDYFDNEVSQAVRELVRDGKIDVMWDPNAGENGDFVYKAVEQPDEDSE